jgi:aspartate carbamoyltransferase catalytic subunit
MSTTTVTAPRPQHWFASAATAPTLLQTCLTQAFLFKQQAAQGVSHRQQHPNAVVATLFQEASTRTRLSFELAAQRLGAHVLHLPTQGSSLAKGETLDDTLLTLAAMGTNVAVLRHQADGLLAQLAERLHPPQPLALVSGGEGVSDHPSQALLDVFTLAEHWGLITPTDVSLPSLSTKTLAIVGHISHSRVVRAHLALAQAVGWRLTLVAPDVWQLPTHEADTWRASGVQLTTTNSLASALAHCDAVMALRVQCERLAPDATCDLAALTEAYTQRYQLTPATLPPNLPLLHPGPTVWGLELHTDLAHPHPRQLLQQQVTNGVWVRMAMLHALLSPSLL